MKENRAFRIIFITKKQTGFAWNFLEIPIQNVQRCISILFQRNLFLTFLLFQKYLNPQVRAKKMVNSVVYHPCPSRLAWRIHPFIFLQTPQGFISLQNVSWIFSNLYILPCAGKIFKFMVFAFLENALNLGIFTHAPVPQSKLQAEIFENLFPPTAERGGENYDLLY